MHIDVNKPLNLISRINRITSSSSLGLWAVTSSVPGGYHPQELALTNTMEPVLADELRTLLLRLFYLTNINIFICIFDYNRLIIFALLLHVVVFKLVKLMIFDKVDKAAGLFAFLEAILKSFVIFQTFLLLFRLEKVVLKEGMQLGWLEITLLLHFHLTSLVGRVFNIRSVRLEGY